MTGPDSPFKHALARGLADDLRRKGVQVFELDFNRLNADISHDCAEASRRISCVTGMFLPYGGIVIVPAPYASRYNNTCDVEIDTSTLPYGNSQADVSAGQLLNLANIYENTWKILVEKEKIVLENL